ncbi:MAG TPA: hypothetical protein PLV25_07595, partial [Opitutales bacterium]|nr:hypothetical protein [Opitutales bacterium]
MNRHLELLETRTLLDASLPSEDNSEPTNVPASSWGELTDDALIMAQGVCAFLAESFDNYLHQPLANGLIMNSKNLAALPLSFYEKTHASFKDAHGGLFKFTEWSATTIDILSASAEFSDSYKAYSTAKASASEACPLAEANLVQYAAQCAVESAHAHNAWDGMWISGLFATYSIAEYLSYYAVESAKNSLGTLLPIAAGGSLAYLVNEGLQALSTQASTHQAALKFIENGNSELAS